MLKPAFVNSWITNSLKKLSTVHVISCYEKKDKNGARVWPLWKQWNFLHVKRIFNSEGATISFYVQYKFQLKLWTETVIRPWDAQLNLVAYMCKDEIKRENLSITLNHNNVRCNISNLCDISVNLLCNNALWRLTLKFVINLRSKRCRMCFCVL